MENVFEQIANENLSEKKSRDLASGMLVSALATIGGLFEMGAEIKVDNTNRAIEITGYDSLNEEYNASNEWGSSQCLRERCYRIEVSINDDGGFNSDFPEVMDEIEADNKRLKTIPSNILKP